MRRQQTQHTSRQSHCPLEISIDPPKHLTRHLKSGLPLYSLRGNPQPHLMLENRIISSPGRTRQLVSKRCWIFPIKVQGSSAPPKGVKLPSSFQTKVSSLSHLLLAELLPRAAPPHRAKYRRCVNLCHRVNPSRKSSRLHPLSPLNEAECLHLRKASFPDQAKCYHLLRRVFQRNDGPFPSTRNMRITGLLMDPSSSLFREQPSDFTVRRCRWNRLTSRTYCQTWILWPWISMTMTFHPDWKGALCMSSLMSRCPILRISSKPFVTECT